MLNLEHTLTGHSDRVWTLAWNPSGTVLASSGGDKTIRLWAAGGDKWICVSVLTESHSKSIRRLCWSPCGCYLASASFDSTVCIWRKNAHDNSWSTVVNLEGHENEVKSVAWSSDGRFIASCGRDRTVWVWERAANPDAEEEFSDDVWDCSDVKSDHNKDVKHVAWHPNHNILASCSYDDSIKLYHEVAGDWNCFQTLTSHSSTVWSIDFSSSGEYMVSVSDDKTVRIWRNHSHDKLPQVEANSWKCISVIQGYHNRTIYDVSWSKAGQFIVTASGDNSLAIYGRDPQSHSDGESFICLDKLHQAHDCDVNSVVWNPKIENLLASASDDRTIKIWRFQPEHEGKKALTISDGILSSLERESAIEDPLRVGAIESHYTATIDSHSGLTKLIQSLQTLQDECLRPDEELFLLERLFDVKVSDHENSSPLQIENNLTDEVTGFTRQLSIKILDRNGSIRHLVKLNINVPTFNLKLPKRSITLVTVAKELFVCDKTGDLFKILPSGDSLLLLGHLFILSDIKFIKERQDTDKIRFIITADRDEKLRISNYPNTFEIERYCFGHASVIRKIVVVNSESFISIDQQDIAKLWNLDTLESSRDKPPRATQTLCLTDSVRKRVCLDEQQSERDNLEVSA